jgi:lipoprotein-anchoring transpeptidase ErfK/SrfK
MFTRRHLIAGLGAATALSHPAFATPRSADTPNAETWVVPPEHQPKQVRFSGNVAANEIHVLPTRRQLFWTLSETEAMQYAVAIGTDDQYEPGTFFVGRKAEWPSWTPTRNMIRRFPEKYAQFRGGVPGGPDNPMGARALYLYTASGRDTLLRIHGTPHPWTIGQAASNGCVRMVNDHVTALYDQVPKGTRVVLHPR